MGMDITIDEEAEFAKLKNIIEKMDHQYYHKMILTRQQYTGRYFPHRGENGALFADTFQYVRNTTSKKNNR